MICTSFQVDKTSQFSRKALQNLLDAGCEIFVNEIALQFDAVWRKNRRAWKSDKQSLIDHHKEML